MIMFGVGLFVGFGLGVVVLACCHVAQRADAGAVKEHLYDHHSQVSEL